MVSLLINLSLDGDKYCALIGENLQEGIAGFADTPTDAIRELCNQIELFSWDLGF